MATATAFITAGGSHPNDGGISPVAMLTLWENSTPAWRCDHLTAARPSTIWVPRRPDTFLEDGLLLLAAVSIDDETVVGLLDGLAGDRWRAQRVEVADIVEQPDGRVSAAVWAAAARAKLVVTVLRGSSLADQLGPLGDHDGDIEVCLPAYWRVSDQWSPEPEVGGHLPASGHG